MGESFIRNEAIAESRLRRAKSNLPRAKAGRILEDVLYEDLCFDCQQAVEKVLKALLISISLEFRRMHLIATLIKTVEANGGRHAQSCQYAALSTKYAVQTRYPGDYEPLDGTDCQEALRIAEAVVNWVDGKIAEVVVRHIRRTTNTQEKA